MQAVVISAPQQMALRERSQPEPPPGWARIRVRAAGICATDLAVLAGDIGSGFPIIPGHEWAGVVDAVGDPADGDWIGRRVVGENDVGCLRCAACRTGRWRFCSQYQQIGFGRYGGAYADYLVAPVYGLHPLADAISFEQGALMEPLAVAVAVIGRARLMLGDTLTVIGDGPIGLGVVIAGRAAGARRILVFGEEPERLALAPELGAREALDHRRVDPADRVKRWHGRSDVVVEATGTAEGIATAVDCVAPEGRVVLAGFSHGRSVPMAVDRIHLPNVAVIGAGNNPGWMRRTLDAVADGVLASDRLVTHRFPLAAYDDALALVGRRGDGIVKAVFVWDG